MPEINIGLIIAFMILLLPFIFFSRGILIFLTALCLIFGQAGTGKISAIALNLRWVFFALFGLHVFGDILLGRTVRRIKSFDIVAIIFIIYTFLSTTYSPYPSLTLLRSTTALFLYISIFWIIWKYAYEQGPERVVYLILQVMMLVLIASYIVIFIAPQRAFMYGRFRGIFFNPNGLAVLCAILLPLSLWQFLETKKKSRLFLFFLMLATLFLTATRGAINATIISLGYFIYVRSKKYRPLAFFTSVSIILILVWVIETAIKQFFMHYIRVESIPTGAGRFEVWPIALNLIADKPIFGYGFGIEEKLFELRHVVLRVHPGGYFHNSYLGMLLQLGILGFILFFVPLFVLLFKELFLRKDSGLPLLRHALCTSLITGLLCGIFESFIYSVGNAQAFPFWVIIMLLTFYHYSDKEKI